MYRKIFHFTHNDADAVGCTLVVQALNYNKSILTGERISDYIYYITYFCKAGGGVDEIIENGYDLSINKYKKVEYVPVEYPPTEDLLNEIEELNETIKADIAELRKLL